MITLKTLAEATDQEVFDQVANHLLDQNARSENANHSCKYRFMHLKCAAGCLIAEDEYKSNIEGWSWPSLVDDKGFPKEHKYLIRDLQKIHDQYDVVNWSLKLKELAEEYNLEFKHV